jgi:hypothetical protein
MNENKMFKPALIGGVLLGILSALPIIGLFNCVCCAWVIAGGILAARLYVKDSPVAVTLGRGALLGLLTGFIGSIVSTIFSIPLNFLSSSSGMNLIEQLRERMKTMPNVPPETQALLDTLSNRSDINALMLIFGLIFTLIVFCLFAMLGSTIGVSIFEKRKVGTPPSDATSYEPPVNLPPPPDAHE